MNYAKKEDACTVWSSATFGFIYILHLYYNRHNQLDADKYQYRNYDVVILAKISELQASFVRV